MRMFDDNIYKYCSVFDENREAIANIFLLFGINSKIIGKSCPGCLADGAVFVCVFFVYQLEILKSEILIFREKRKKSSVTPKELFKKNTNSIGVLESRCRSHEIDNLNISQDNWQKSSATPKRPFKTYTNSLGVLMSLKS